MLAGNGSGSGSNGNGGNGNSNRNGICGVSKPHTTAAEYERKNRQKKSRNRRGKFGHKKKSHM